MILTVTLNPMLDKTVTIDRLRRGEIHRASGVACVVGGKGVNVSRQLQRFGVETTATGLVGGEVGLQLLRLLTAEGLRNDFFRIGGMTREGVTYREEGNSWTAIFEPPHEVTGREAEEFVLHCARLFTPSAWVVCSGSSPCAQTDQTYARIIALAQQNGCKTYLDSYGAAFREALRVRPTVVQCNRTELSAGLEKSLKGEQDLLDAMAKVIEAGVQLVLVTDGPRSAYAADGEKIWRVIPPAVEAINPTGSGDCVVAGMLKELSAGHPVESGLRYGAAAGGVNATRWEVATVSLQEVEELLSEVRVEQIT